ncbi:uncharacterized protein N7469_007758 [Penicillium citrinum]|uniref:Bacteriocin-protection protein, YdeI/OmpD-associated family n=1 Tax=Penicillium citrinum TaxID=5077 RepID=A0A9W9TK79_PENCI|nr:uncharacterized protein N7469_007758 [Penicillium citrinum]KAJ5224255.1 hypothetical protein N7469_007758 [Penicillium citrinum]
MSSKQPPSDLPIYAFPNAQELEDFLEQEHLKAPGFYLKLAKKSSGIPSVSAAHAVETALCFGWIDGRANGFDKDWWLVRYTPRRAKSIWSQKNVNTIGQLIEMGRMRPAGLAAVEAAKADGRWQRAYAGPATMKVPDDFAAALAGSQSAQAFFNALNKSDRYSVLWRVQTSSPTARRKRIETLVAMLAKGEQPTTSKPSSTRTEKDRDGDSVNKNTGTAGASRVKKSILSRPRRSGLRSSHST